MSKVSVSRALRGDLTYLAQTTYDRIHKTAKEMGYDPANGHLARRLALRRVGQQVLNNVVAVISPSDFYAHNFYHEVFRGLYEGLVPEQFAALVHYTDGSGESRLPSLFGRGDVDGVVGIFQNSAFLSHVLELMPNVVGSGVRPAVSILAVPTQGCSSVNVDIRAGGYASAAHLLDLGHRHILYFLVPDDYDNGEPDRVLGFGQACMDRGLDPDRCLYALPPIDGVSVGTARAELESALSEMLAAHPEITAVVAKNDIAAAQCIGYFKRRGLRVPDDMSVVGFDDTDAILDDLGSNILTSVRLPLQDVGREAARIVLDLVTSRVSEVTRSVLPVELFVRKTTAKPRE